jgi:hypothetical protein
MLGASPRNDVLVGSVSDFPPNTVSYVPDRHFFVVNWGSGLRVLDETPPDSRTAEPQCHVRYYSASADPKASAHDEPGGGFFKDDCNGPHFNWWRGENLSTTCQCGLDHYLVRIDGDKVFVDTTKRLAFTWEY